MAKKINYSNAYAFTILGLLLPGLSFALGLGPLQQQSQLGEPFKAEIALTDVGSTSFDQIAAYPASQDDLARFALASDGAAPTLSPRMTVVRGKNGQPVVRMSSDTAITEPYVSFYLHLRWPNGDFVKRYNILLNPPGETRAMTQPQIPVKKSVKPVSKAAKPFKSAQPKSVVQPSQVKSQVNALPETNNPITATVVPRTDVTAPAVQVPPAPVAVQTPVQPIAPTAMVNPAQTMASTPNINAVQNMTPVTQPVMMPMQSAATTPMPAKPLQNIPVTTTEDSFSFMNLLIAFAGFSALLAIAVVFAKRQKEFLRQWWENALQWRQLRASKESNNTDNNTNEKTTLVFPTAQKKAEMVIDVLEEAEIYISHHRIDKAIQLLTKATYLHPERKDISLRLAQCYELASKPPSSNEDPSILETTEEKNQNTEENDTLHHIDFTPTTQAEKPEKETS